MKKSLLIILVLLTSISCLNAKQRRHQAGNSILSVSMQRTPCFGRCPDYIIEIKQNGLVTYSGIMFTKDTGVYKKNIGAGNAKKLFDQFNTYRVDTCKDRYPQPYADAPGINFTITYKSKTKTIIDAHFGPPFLKQLARDVDALSKVDSTWKKVADKATQ